MLGNNLKTMDTTLPVRISFRNGPSLHVGASIEEVIAIMGSPSEQWDDGVEAYLGYHFPTHEISFSFEVRHEGASATWLTTCEVWVHHKLPCIKDYDVVTSSENGGLRKTYEHLPLSEASKRMSDANHSHGIASHWISSSGSLFDTP